MNHLRITLHSSSNECFPISQFFGTSTRLNGTFNPEYSLDENAKSPIFNNDGGN